MHDVGGVTRRLLDCSRQGCAAGAARIIRNLSHGHAASLLAQLVISLQYIRCNRADRGLSFRLQAFQFIDQRFFFFKQLAMLAAQPRLNANSIRSALLLQRIARPPF